jgi:CBS-domain-containing membrane protein
MTPNPYTVPATTEIRMAITMMLKHRFSSLPVVNDGRLVGILTVTDLVIMLQVTLQLLDKLLRQHRLGERHVAYVHYSAAVTFMICLMLICLSAIVS